ncbi:MAG: restriction endonuclease [Nanoarchaeota archaeon]
MSSIKKSDNIIVKKLNGDTEKYNPKKLRKSLKEAGADKEVINNILKKVEGILYNGIETRKLFRFIHEELDKQRPQAGLKYNLKRAMFDMRVHGGFTFEKFIGRVLEKQGYKIEMNPLLKGAHVTHEIDIFAEKDNEKLMIEVKHHKKPGIIEPIQTALYVYARFLELKDKFTQPMLVTNTKFSNQVIKYSKGVGIKLMGWKYPRDNSLEENIEKYKLYPVTILNLSKTQIRRYLQEGILTLQELKEQKKVSKKTREQINTLLNE